MLHFERNIPTLQNKATKQTLAQWHEQKFSKEKGLATTIEILKLIVEKQGLFVCQTLGGFVTQTPILSQLVLISSIFLMIIIM